jgi:hypothetical protein
MGVLSQMADWLRGDQRGRRDILGDLLGDYHDEVTAAAQLRAHAACVPYPQAATYLRQLAEVEDRHAAELARQIATVGGRVTPVTPEVRHGTNHWYRMTASLAAADEKRRRLIEQAVRWDGDYPVVAAVLAHMAAEETAQRRLLEELVTRADSLALD